MTRHTLTADAATHVDRAPGPLDGITGPVAAPPGVGDDEKETP
jgi:hypothetical protein